MDEEFVMERLDRAFASLDWINSYPSYALRNHLILHSNHGPIILKFDPQHPFKHRPFSFEHMLLTHPSCKEIVQNAWNFQTFGSTAFQLKSKTSKLRDDLLYWNKYVFGKVELKIYQKQNQLQAVQNSIISQENARRENF